LRTLELRYHPRSNRRHGIFPGRHLRDGYLRADPGDPAAVRKQSSRRATCRTFEKPHYITFERTYGPLSFRGDRLHALA